MKGVSGLYYHARLQDGQEIGALVLDAEVKLCDLKNPIADTDGDSVAEKKEFSTS